MAAVYTIRLVRTKAFRSEDIGGYLFIQWSYGLNFALYWSIIGEAYFKQDDLHLVREG